MYSLWSDTQSVGSDDEEPVYEYLYIYIYVYVCVVL